MKTVKSALSLILRKVPKLSPKTLPLSDAFESVLAENIRAKQPLPSWDNSAVDGYAIKSTDTQNASRNQPVLLKVIGTLYAGQFPRKKIVPGMALRIMTGAPLPDGADAIVMKEDINEQRRLIGIFKAIRKEENIRRKGGDVQKGKIILKSGSLLSSASWGLCASLGYKKMRIVPKPVVTILSTGDELTGLNTRLTRGQIRDSNSWILKGLSENAGAQTIVSGIVKDTQRQFQKVLSKAFEKSNTVVVSGGVSVGKADYVRKVLEKMGAKIYFGGVAMKPGKPFLFATYKGKPFFGLPGNPVSAFVTFQLFVRPALLKMAGKRPASLPRLFAKLDAPLKIISDRQTFLRGKLFGENESECRVKVLSGQSSHQIATLAQSDCLVDIPAGKIFYPKGKRVPVFLLN